MTSRSLPAIECPSGGGTIFRDSGGGFSNIPPGFFSIEKHTHPVFLLRTP
jgi:hypothetical protein